MTSSDAKNDIVDLEKFLDPLTYVASETRVGDGAFRWWISTGDDPELYDFDFDTCEETLVEAKLHAEYNTGFTLIEMDGVVMPSTIDEATLAQIVIDHLVSRNSNLLVAQPMQVLSISRKAAQRLWRKFWVSGHPGNRGCAFDVAANAP